MGNSDHCRPNPETKAEAVDCFRLTNGHFGGVYLHWLGLAADEAFPLGSHARMDGNHLIQCTELNEYPDDVVINRYRESMRQIVKKPSTGVG
ncbi:reverse transcriptase [Trichonephila clavipes]|nr:reverse transcriptase [Trichonephila clavipes]